MILSWLVAWKACLTPQNILLKLGIHIVAFVVDSCFFTFLRSLLISNAGEGLVLDMTLLLMPC
jgi:hypothetical protein